MLKPGRCPPFEELGSVDLNVMAQSVASSISRRSIGGGGERDAKTGAGARRA
jgi:hypothetical protein